MSVSITSLYRQLFGKRDPVEGSVIDMSEHGRVGGVSTGQPFKYVASINPTSGVLISGDEKIIYDSDATYEYFAFAPPGSSTASAIWKVIRIDGNGQKTHADGDALYDNVATSIGSLSYS